MRRTATNASLTMVAMANEKFVSPVPLASELANPAEKTAIGVNVVSITTLWICLLNGNRNYVDNVTTTSNRNCYVTIPFSLE